MTMSERTEFSGDEALATGAGDGTESDIETMIEARVAAFQEQDKASWSADAIERASQLVEALEGIPEIANQITSDRLKDPDFRPTWLMGKDDPALRRLVSEFANATPSTDAREGKRLAERMARMIIRPAWSGILEATGSGQADAEEVAWEILSRMDAWEEEVATALTMGDGDRR